ncbi:MAG: hypothetical protein ABL903_01520 [Methylococcales bacterium]
MVVVGLLALVGFFLGIYLILKTKNIDIWIVSYIKASFKKTTVTDGPIHIMFCFVDHYEPQWAIKDDIATERTRVDRWVTDYPKLCAAHFDADGKHPQHSFFYPEEEYRAEHLTKLADLCKNGYGEVEIHLHHDNDTPDNLRNTLSGFASILQERHGLLSTCPETNQPAYAFIHGNWCLCNARKDGRWCGINEELGILKKTGCYADFTLPAAPNESQTAKINSIYYAKDIPGKPKAHNDGIDVAVGGKPSGDLMIIQGPLTLNWKKRKFGIMPRIEASDMRRETPPTRERVDLWVNANIHVSGRPEWLFVKIHTHGTQEQDMDTLLGQPVDEMFSYLEAKYNDGQRYVLHYVTAREVFNIIKAAEAGLEGNPNAYRDYILKPPHYLVKH